MVRNILRTLSVICLAGTLAVWFALGAHTGWTKTSVTTMKVDEITGLEFPVVEKRFVPGVEFLAAGLVGSVLLGGLSLFPNPLTKKP